MKASVRTEITVSLKNEAGELARAFSEVSKAGVNILAYTAYVEGAHGFLKFVPDAPEKASQALENAGYNSSSKTVLAVEVEDKVGAGAEAALKIATAGVNVTHTHGSTSGEGTALLIFHTSDNQAALAALNE